jgi:hypothetical protein
MCYFSCNVRQQTNISTISDACEYVYIAKFYYIPIMTKNLISTLGLGAIFLLIVSVVSSPFPFPVAVAQSETTLAERVTSYLGQAESAVTAGNTTEASDKIGLAIAEISNLLGEITADNGRYNDTHTHTITHNGKTTHITHTHPHNTDHHHGDWFTQHHEFNPSNCNPGLMC